MKNVSTALLIVLVVGLATGAAASKTIGKKAWVNTGTVANPVLQQVTMAENCVIGSTSPCTITLAEGIFQVYHTASAAANFDSAFRYMHP